VLLRRPFARAGEEEARAAAHDGARAAKGRLRAVRGLLRARLPEMLTCQRFAAESVHGVHAGRSVQTGTPMYHSVACEQHFITEHLSCGPNYATPHDDVHDPITSP